MLLVEDEILLRMMIAGVLEELGLKVAAEAGTTEAALLLAKEGTFDLAILYVNLGGPNNLPVAEIPLQRESPSYSPADTVSASLPEAFNDRPMLRKPFRLDQLAEPVEELTAA